MTTERQWSLATTLVTEELVCSILVTTLVQDDDEEVSVYDVIMNLGCGAVEYRQLVATKGH